MTMHEEWTNKLSDFLDGELEAAEEAAVAAHLRECPDCSAVLNDLKRVVARAQAIDVRPPQRDLWPGVSARIDRLAPALSLSRGRRFSFTLPQLAAAAAVLVAVSGALAVKLTERAAAPASVAQAPALPAADTTQASAADRGAAADSPVVERVSLADAQYDAAVADLEKALKNGRGRLDKATIEIVENNLQIIDQAIAQAREALAADPANGYLSGHLVEARRRKLDLLRRAAALAETD
jgi:anti-sigma factor RsiW